MYGFPMPPGFEAPYGYSGYVPKDEAKTTRYCPNRDCASAQLETASAPCWACGGPTTWRKPAWWPYSGTGQTVIGGDSYTVGEEQLPEAPPQAKPTDEGEAA